MARASCALDFADCVDIAKSLNSIAGSGYDFVCLPIVHPRYKREFIEGPAKNRPGPLTRSDLLLTSHDWSSIIVGKISPWLRLDSPLKAERQNSEKALLQELLFASHLSLPAVLIKLRSGNCINLARALYEHSLSLASHQYWLHIPMKAPACTIDASLFTTDLSQVQPEDDTWLWWNKFRSLANGMKKLCVALELSSDLPAEEILERWYGEPVKAFILPTSLFLTNKKGFPVLSKAHQLVVKRLLRLDAQAIITGNITHSGKSYKVYQQYLDFLSQSQEPLDSLSEFAKGYEDYLQCPLQPLMDNLESQTYETFERDPIKYNLYHEATWKALLDRVSEEDKDKTVVTVMVVGAGRGPLVKATLSAASKVGRRVHVYAVEKNPNAVVTLENLKAEEWGDQVTVVSCDMRVWKAPEKADILISELLGSFGDNELSPECLDGAQSFLKEDGISIPEQYTSWVAPLQMPKLYNDIRASRDKDKPPETPFEMPYVVRLHNCRRLDEPQPVFTFQHPNWELTDNERYAELTFDCKVDSIMHGFAGYFHCILYKDVVMSILPALHSPGMLSWFPILFPIKEPVFVAAGDKVIVHLWRRVSAKDVWYEWCITSPQVTPIHNPKGRSYTIGL